MHRALLCGLLALANQATAQDDFQPGAPAFAHFRELVGTGDLTSGTIPSAEASANGCQVIFTARAVSPELGVPVTFASAADARTLGFADWQPEIREDRVTARIPANRTAMLHMSLSATDAASRALFSERWPAVCSETGCKATVPRPAFFFVVFDRPLEDALAARDALAAFSETCV